MKNLIYLVLGVISILLVEACHEKKSKNYNQETLVDQQGLNFIRDGIEGGLTEIKASGLAITKSSNQRVIGFAKMMISDHTQTGNELKKIENDKRVTEADTISGDHQKMISDLTKKSGSNFDKAYMQMMVKDHENAVKLFADATTNNEVEIQNFAKKTLPTLKMHLDSAKVIVASLK
jgi:putative membrane protein